MDTPFIVWGCIVALFIFIFLSRFIQSLVFRLHSKHPFIELGSEREEVFVPGDPIPLDDDNDPDSSDKNKS